MTVRSKVVYMLAPVLLQILNCYLLWICYEWWEKIKCFKLNKANCISFFFKKNIKLLKSAKFYREIILHIPKRVVIRNILTDLKCAISSLVIWAKWKLTKLTTTQANVLYEQKNCMLACSKNQSNFILLITSILIHV